MRSRNSRSSQSTSLVENRKRNKETLSKLPTYEEKPIPTRVPITSFGEIIDPRLALTQCKSGFSFVVDTHKFRQRVIGYARRLGIEVRTAKNGTGRFDIWRI